MLVFVHGNTRAMERISNVLLLGVNFYDSRQLTQDLSAFLQVVLMVEQWPFRLVLFASASNESAQCWKRFRRHNRQQKQYVHVHVCTCTFYLILSRNICMTK